MLVHELSNQKCEEAYELVFMIVCFWGISFVLASLPSAVLAQQEPSVFARRRALLYQSVGKHGDMDRHCCDGFAVPNRFLQSLLAQCHKIMIMHLGATAMISEPAPPWQLHYLMNNLPMPAAMWLVDTVTLETVTVSSDTAVSPAPKLSQLVAATLSNPRGWKSEMLRI